MSRREAPRGTPVRPLTVSVVVASLVGAPFLDDCIASLEGEARDLDAEVIVVACGRSDAERIGRRFPRVRVVQVETRQSVPRLRRIGVEAASGEVVAVIEEHCLAGKDWLQAALDAHAADVYAAVGGPVVDHGYERVRDWVVYLCEYSGSLPPAVDGEVRDLNGANIAYRRRALLDHLDLLDDGYWEVRLHPALLARGGRLRSVPAMVVHHRGPFALGYYLQQRYWFSRAFAGARRGTMPLPYRLAYLVAAPVVPGLLLGRMAWRVWQKRRYTAEFLRALPLLIPAVTVLVAGEWVGYLAGPGNALSKVE